MALFAALANVGPVHDILYVFEYDYITPKALKGHAHIGMRERSIHMYLLVYQVHVYVYVYGP